MNRQEKLQIIKHSRFDGNWEESKHPRAKDGKFSSVPGSGSSKEPDPNKDRDKKLKADLKKKILADKDFKLTIDDIANDPAIQSALKQVGKMGEPTHTINTEERQNLRKKISNEIVERGSIDKNGKFTGPVKREFRAEIVIGPPAAGKSSVIVDNVSKATGSRVIDSDEIKKLLPEYESGLGASRVRMESNQILDSLVMPNFLKYGKNNGDNLVIPIVGRNSGGAEAYATMLKKAGYSVHLSYNDVPSTVAAKRAALRYIDEGRFLPIESLKDIGKRCYATYEKLKKTGIFDSYSKFNNNVEYGKPAKKIEHLGKDLKKKEWESWR